MMDMMDDLLSYHHNMMLAAFLSLLLVILFTLLLHIFARKCLSNLPNHHTGNTNTTTASSYYFDTIPHPKGLDASTIASIPVFVYDDHLSEQLECCAICLSGFEDGEIGRMLQSCSHAFHVECIDMWLCSHFTCPICRSLVQPRNSSHILMNNKAASAALNDGVSVVIGSVTELRNSDATAGSEFV